MKMMIAVVVFVVAHLNPVSLFEGEWRTDVPPDLRASCGIGVVPSGIGFAVKAGKVKITHRSVSPIGPSRGFEEVFQTDGKPHPSKEGPGWTVTATWSDPYSLDLMFTGRGDRIATVHTTYSLSSDQKTLTVRSVYSASGYVQERIFYR